jgi:hypothetical protein
MAQAARHPAAARINPRRAIMVNIPYPAVAVILSGKEKACAGNEAVDHPPVMPRPECGQPPVSPSQPVLWEDNTM